MALPRIDPEDDHRPARPASDGGARVDTAPSLAGHVYTTLNRPEPPPHGTVIAQPAAPQPPPAPDPPAPWPGPLSQLMPPLVTLDGSVLPAPTDGVVRAKPPAPPKPR